jgi:hypothetical protein
VSGGGADVGTCASAWPGADAGLEAGTAVDAEFASDGLGDAGTGVGVDVRARAAGWLWAIAPGAIGASVAAGGPNSHDMLATMTAEAIPDSKTTLQRTRAGGKTVGRATRGGDPPTGAVSLAAPARATNRRAVFGRVAPSGAAVSGDRYGRASDGNGARPSEAAPCGGATIVAGAPSGATFDGIGAR